MILSDRSFRVFQNQNAIDSPAALQRFDYRISSDQKAFFLKRLRLPAVVSFRRSAAVSFFTALHRRSDLHPLSSAARLIRTRTVSVRIASARITAAGTFLFLF